MSAIEPRLLRAAAGSFLTGVTIATTIAPGGQPCGVTVNSFTTVSLDPPLVLFCIGRSNRSFHAFDMAPSFAVNVLSSEQRGHSLIFASKAEDKFARVEWRPGKTGSPLLCESLATFDCASHARVEAGDHIMLIGHVVAIGHRPGAPLGYFPGNYVELPGAADAVAWAPRTAG